MYVNSSWNDLGPGQATAINSHDQVVGDTDPDVNGTQGLGGHPFLYQDGHTVDLNNLIPANSGWVLLTARGINNSGQIVGTGIFNGEYHAYRLTLTLLGRWAPELVYDSQEGYKADSAAEITDNYQPSYTNILYDGNNVPLAAADPSNPSDTLSLSYLTFPNYPSGVQTSSADHIDEADSYAVDVQRLEALPQYANQMYGRVVPEPGGQYELQYWFFEYLNSKTFVGFGQHEGDWEMVQVHLGGDGNPIGAAYAQHTGGEVCPWSNVKKTEDGRPIVYVAQGSHASYYTSGQHDLAIWGLFGAYDTNDARGAVITPTAIDVTNPPQWISSWPGLWGGSTSGADTSPKSPGQQGQKWSDPLGWEVAQGVNCSAPVQGAMRVTTHGASGMSYVGAQRADSPPLPKLTARIVGRRVRISFRFKSFPQGHTRRPWQLITSVVSATKKYPPLTFQTQLRGRRTGLLSQPLGLGHGPYRFLFSVRSPSGTRSRTVDVALH